MVEEKKFSKYERARIVGARGLQISMDAPLLLKLSKDELEELNYDSLKIAEKELDAGVLPISVNRPMPKRKEESLEKIKIEDIASDDEKVKVEEEEEKEMVEGSEILELANVEEEIDGAPEESDAGEME